MLEKRLSAILNRPFIVDGTVNGVVTISSTIPFKVKQEIIISANTLPPLELEVKRVIDATTLVVGPKTANINDTKNISAYTVALNAAISAPEQKRPSIPYEEHERANYEEEPTVADRVILVDELGNKYNQGNRLPVDATVNLTASKPNKHTIFNHLVTAANTQQVVLLPDKTEIINIFVRSKKAITLQYTFVSGETNTKYMSVSPGVRKEITGVGLSGVTPLYFELNLTDVGGTIVEIETWSV